MEDAVTNGTFSVLPISVDTFKFPENIVEPRTLGTDSVLDTMVLPARVENVILDACTLLTVIVERTVS
jgi:hypothetical protein